MITVDEFKKIDELISIRLTPVAGRLGNVEKKLDSLEEKIGLVMDTMLEMNKKLDANIAFLQGNVSSNSEELKKVEFQTDYLMQRDVKLRERRAS